MEQMLYKHKTLVGIIDENGNETIDDGKKKTKKNGKKDSNKTVTNPA